MNYVDALGPDEVLEQAVVAAPGERIDRVGCERDPLTAMGLEISHERPLATSDKGTGAGLQQNLRDVDGRAGVGLLPQRWHHLQDGGARKRWRGVARLVESVAHCPLWNRARPVLPIPIALNIGLALFGRMRRNNAGTIDARIANSRESHE
jgi:hypothetical protein